MKRIIPNIRSMTYEEQQEIGLQNPGLILDYEGRSYERWPLLVGQVGGGNKVVAGCCHAASKRVGPA